MTIKELNLFNMGVLIAIEMHPVLDVCKKLAGMKRRNKDYDRQQVDKWILKWVPTAQKFGGQYMLTYSEIRYISDHVRVNKLRQKDIDNRQ